MSKLSFAYYIGFVFGITLGLIISRFFRMFVLCKRKKKIKLWKLSTK